MEKFKDKKMPFAKPVLGLAAYSGTGKTTLLVKLLPLMKLQGLRVAMVKHTHHDFDIDKPGKDSFELRKAGADQVLLASDRSEERRVGKEGRARWGVGHRTQGRGDWDGCDDE